MRIVRTSLALALLTPMLIGCPTDPPPRIPLDAGRRDAGSPPIEPPRGVDTDGEGLCDRTELSLGTDPMNVDSDGDGFSDRVERDLGFMPLRPASPDRDRLIFIDETEEASAQLSVPVVVRSAGMSFTGVFEPLAAFDNLPDITASDFLVRAFALGATPMENVFAIDPEAQTFFGVDGRNTELVWELEFAFGTNFVRECTRAYSFRYFVKGDDGRVVSANRYYLIVLPRGQRLETAEWCVPEGACL